MNDKNNIPKNWQVKKFDEILDYIQPTKYIVESTDYSEKNKIPVLTAGKSFILGYTNESKGIFDKLPVIIFDDFTTANKFVNFPFKVKSSAMKILAPKNKLHNIKYAFYYMQTIRVNADTHKRYWISEYSKLEIPLPPLSEQHRIVAKIEELFSELDSGIQNLKKAKEQIKTYRQSVLKWAFEGKLTEKWRMENEEWRMENDEFEMAAEPEGEYKKSLPDGWKWLKLGECATLITKGASPRWQGFNYIKDNRELLFITSENVRNNYLDISDPKYLSLEFNKIQKRSILNKDDVLFNLVGASIGRATIYNLDRLSNINQAVALIRLKPILNNKYLSFFLNAEIAKHVYLLNIVDVARANLSLTDTCNIQIPLCPLAEQTQIVSEIEKRFSEADKLEESIDKSLQQSEMLRQSILKKAFEGRLASAPSPLPCLPLPNPLPPGEGNRVRASAKPTTL